MSVPARASRDALGSVPGPSPEADLVRLFLLRYDRENTRRSYARDLATFFGSATVTLAMAAGVSFEHVNTYAVAMERDGLALATQRRRIASLRTFFGWLIALGGLPTNPADRHLVRRIAPDNPRDRVLTVLTREQARALIDAVPADLETAVRDRALIQTLLHCVLRRSEASAMDVEHLRPAGPYWVLDLPRAKGGANQTVKVPEHVAVAIHHHAETYAIRSGALWRSHSKNASRGRRLSTSSIYSIVQRTALRAGLPDKIGAHTLRHTGCTLAIEGGASVQQVQIHARHKNIETTMLYVHQRDRLANSAADFIDL